MSAGYSNAPQFHTYLECKVEVKEEDWQSEADQTGSPEYTMDHGQDAEEEFILPHTQEESSSARDSTHILLLPKGECLDMSGVSEENTDVSCPKGEMDILQLARNTR